MEYNFSGSRLILLTVLLAGLFLLKGFSFPTLDLQTYSPAGFRKVWLLSILLFLTGAACTSIVDHEVGTLDRTNLRFLYVTIGIVSMAAAILWQYLLRRSA